MLLDDLQRAARKKLITAAWFDKIPFCYHYALENGEEYSLIIKDEVEHYRVTCGMQIFNIVKNGDSIKFKKTLKNNLTIHH